MPTDVRLCSNSPVKDVEIWRWIIIIIYGGVDASGHTRCACWIVEPLVNDVSEYFSEPVLFLDSNAFLKFDYRLLSLRIGSALEKVEDCFFFGVATWT